jgi:hypothetical protein
MDLDRIIINYLFFLLWPLITFLYYMSQFWCLITRLLFAYMYGWRNFFCISLVYYKALWVNEVLGLFSLRLFFTNISKAYCDTAATSKASYISLKLSQNGKNKLSKERLPFKNILNLEGGSAWNNSKKYNKKMWAS